ncbi:MAG: cytochrome c [Nitrospira sp.]|nr:cytochrome c [Nitrospira sp.]
MKKRVIGVAVAICLVTLGMIGWVGYQLFTTGFSAKTEPHALEVLIARQIRHLAVPLAQRNAPNPVPLTPTVLKDARAHFADHCAICHANDGSGRTPIGKNVYPKAPDLRRTDTQSMSDGELFWAIHNGIRFTAMPAWGGDEPEKDLDSWKLVHFIRHLPNLTPEELHEMKGLNPKTRHEMEEEAANDKFLEGDDAAGDSDGHHH